jgi:hypothetical protein
MNRFLSDYSDYNCDTIEEGVLIAKKMINEQTRFPAKDIDENTFILQLNDELKKDKNIEKRVVETKTWSIEILNVIVIDDKK